MLKQLKAIGFTDDDIKELDNLSKIFEDNDLYRKIGKLNQSTLGVNIQPSYISPDIITERITRDDKATPSSIIGEYKEDIQRYSQGSTTNIDNYLEAVSNELAMNDINAPIDKLSSILNNNSNDFEVIEEFIAYCRKYEEEIEDGIAKVVSYYLYLWGKVVDILNTTDIDT